MNTGSRVTTPAGPGTLVRLVIDHRWAFNRPDVITWAAVQLDGKAYPQMFHPAHVKETPMETTEQTGGLLIQEPENTTTDPDPEPVPDPTEPEPEGEEADEKLEELIEFPE